MKPPNLPHSIRASERNLNDKNLIHGQKHHQIFLFSADNLKDPTQDS